MKTKTKKDCRPIPQCCECGGTNVETTAWIDYRDDGSERVVNSEGPFSGAEGNWCHDCDAHVELDYPTTTPRQDRTRQRNSAAREHGPEMLKLLRDLMYAMEGTCEFAMWDDGWQAIYKRAKRQLRQITNGKP